jgi:hypothetical protein
MLLVRITMLTAGFMIAATPPLLAAAVGLPVVEEVPVFVLVAIPVGVEEAPVLLLRQFPPRRCASSRGCGSMA